MNLETILSRLQKVRKSGAGFMACCPAHEDKSPSLRVADGGDKALLCCYAGCSPIDVLTAIGLDWADAFECMVPPKLEYVERLTDRDIKAFAHTYSTDLGNLRSEGMACTDEQKKKVERSRVRLVRFADRYGAAALTHLVRVHRDIYEAAPCQ